MEKDRCDEAAQLLLSALTREKQAKADQLRAILALAQNYTASIDTIIDDDLIEDLVENIATGGSFGTIPISEFAAMELGPLMGCSPQQGKAILFETLNLYYRHRNLWQAVQDLCLDAHRARKAAGKFGVLTPKAAQRAGELWVERQHRYGWQGAIDLCDRIIVEMDPVMAAEKEAARLRAREVKLWGFHEATINLTATLDALDAKYVYATATRIAEILHAKPEYTKVALDVLRAKALGIMAHPAVALAMLQGGVQQPIFGTTADDVAEGLADAEPDPATTSASTAGKGNDVPATARAGAEAGTGCVNNDTVAASDGASPPPPTAADSAAHEVIDTATGRIDTDPHHCLGHTCGTITVPPAKLQPRAQIYIHLTADITAADIEDAGTVAARTLVELLDGKQVTITPVIDLNTIPSQYQYRPSKALKEAIQLTWPREAFPYSNRNSRGCDLDHTDPYQAANRDAQTRLDNLAPLSRTTHRAKTAGFWRCDQPHPGQLTWTSPLGFRYTIDKNGTRRIE